MAASLAQRAIQGRWKADRYGLLTVQGRSVHFDTPGTPSYELSFTRDGLIKLGIWQTQLDAGKASKSLDEVQRGGGARNSARQAAIAEERALAAAPPQKLRWSRSTEGGADDLVVWRRVPTASTSNTANSKAQAKQDHKRAGLEKTVEASSSKVKKAKTEMEQREKKPRESELNEEERMTEKELHEAREVKVEMEQREKKPKEQELHELSKMSNKELHVVSKAKIKMEQPEKKRKERDEKLQKEDTRLEKRRRGEEMEENRKAKLEETKKDKEKEKELEALRESSVASDTLLEDSQSLAQLLAVERGTQPSEVVDSGNRDAEAPLALDGSAVNGVQALQAASSNDCESAKPLVEGEGASHDVHGFQVASLGEQTAVPLATPEGSTAHDFGSSHAISSDTPASAVLVAGEAGAAQCIDPAQGIDDLHGMMEDVTQTSCPLESHEFVEEESLRHESELHWLIRKIATTGNNDEVEEREPLKIRPRIHQTVVLPPWRSVW